VVKDDRFVLRSYSPVITIGGGQILNPIPQKHKRFNTEIIDGLKKLLDASPQEVISCHLQAAGLRGIPFSDLKIMTNLTEKKLADVIAGLLSNTTIMVVNKDNRTYIHQDSFSQLKHTIRTNLAGYHQKYPLKRGIIREELKSKLSFGIDSKLFNLGINKMIKAQEVAAEENIIRLADHKVSLGIDQADIKQKIVAAYADAALTPPYFRELCQTMGINASQAKDVLQLLLEEGRLVKIKEDLYFDARAVEQLKHRLVDFLRAQQEITTPQFKEMTAASRKYVIPLIEYFDATNVTIRIGDIRKLRKGS
jgi:selenocysteine-specific elongation factor